MNTNQKIRIYNIYLFLKLLFIGGGFAALFYILPANKNSFLLIPISFFLLACLELFIAYYWHLAATRFSIVQGKHSRIVSYRNFILLVGFGIFFLYFYYDIATLTNIIVLITAVIFIPIIIEKVNWIK